MASKLLLNVLYIANAYAQENTILPFSKIEENKIERPEQIEQERRLAEYILKGTARKNVRYHCYTDISEGRKDFSSKKIQYQACQATIQLDKTSFKVTITNQNEERKDEGRTLSGQADYMVIIQEPSTFIGQDEFLDGKLESGNPLEFYETIEKLLKVYE